MFWRVPEEYVITDNLKSCIDMVFTARSIIICLFDETVAI